MLDELSKSLTPRLMFMLLLALATLILSTGYSALFKQPIKQYKQQQTQLANLQQLPSDQSLSNARITQLRQEISDLNALLTKTGHEVLKGTTPMKVLADLGELAKEHDVQLLNVSPGSEIKGETYTEVPFDVSVSGTYGQIFKWVYSLEHAALPLFIKQFSLSPGTSLEQRELKISVALVQPASGEHE